jgi:multiple sugar transport system substrate-binding protein
MSNEHAGRRRSDISRRDLLTKGGAAGLAAAGAGLLGTTPRGRQARAQEAVEIVFSFAPDESGSMENLIERFNEQQRGRVRVRWREMPVESDDYRQELGSEFLVRSPEIDVIGGDVIWTPEFAYRGWIQDLSSRFYDAYSPEDFLQASMNSASYRFRIWAVPWFSDIGMLYYRKDLLERAGFAQPPATWDELKQMALRVTADGGARHGFVFQGAQYEGGVTNALEYIWSARGRVMSGDILIPPTHGAVVADPEVITVASDHSARGLDIARSMITDGVAPEEVATLNEQEALAVFLAGDAVFMRNWPFAYGIVAASDEARIAPEQVGVAPIPVASEGWPSFSCLGGWNLMISALSPNANAAWEFIRFATSAEAQKQRALEGGFMPSLRSLYADPEILEGVPVVALGRDVFADARARPQTPFYPQISRRIAVAFNRVLRGELTGQEAAQRLDRELRIILRANR